MTTYTILVAVQVVIALSLIGLILVQHGKGADAGAAFGSGASGTVFGAQGSANFLSHATAALATVFFALSLALAYLVGGNAAPSGSSVTQKLEQTTVTTQAPANKAGQETAQPAAGNAAQAQQDETPVFKMPGDGQSKTKGKDNGGISVEIPK